MSKINQATKLNPMRALSIRQPWAWMILHAGKTLENRPRRTHIRETILIHASKGMTTREYLDAMTFWENIGIPAGARVPQFWEFELGGIVGQVDIVDCVQESNSPWFTGPFGYVLTNPKVLPFRPCRGQLGFFTPKFESP